MKKVIETDMAPKAIGPYSPPEDVHRTAAGMFTISYTGGVIVPTLGGALWDLTGAPWTAFCQLALCALVLTAAGLRRARLPASR